MLNLKVKKGRRERDIYRERWTTKSEGDGVHTPLMRVVSLLNFSDFLSRFYAFDSFIQPKIERSFGHEISSSLTFTWNAFLSFLAGREDSFVWNSLRSASILYTRFYMQLTLSIHKTRPNCVCVWESFLSFPPLALREKIISGKEGEKKKEKTFFHFAWSNWGPRLPGTKPAVNDLAVWEKDRREREIEQQQQQRERNTHDHFIGPLFLLNFWPFSFIVFKSEMVICFCFLAGRSITRGKKWDDWVCCATKRKYVVLSRFTRWAEKKKQTTTGFCSQGET